MTEPTKKSPVRTHTKPHPDGNRARASDGSRLDEQGRVVVPARKLQEKPK